MWVWRTTGVVGVYRRLHTTTENFVGNSNTRWHRVLNWFQISLNGIQVYNMNPVLRLMWMPYERMKRIYRVPYWFVLLYGFTRRGVWSGSVGIWYFHWIGSRRNHRTQRLLQPCLLNFSFHLNWYRRDDNIVAWYLVYPIHSWEKKYLFRWFGVGWDGCWIEHKQGLQREIILIVRSSDVILKFCIVFHKIINSINNDPTINYSEDISLQLHRS